MARTRMLLCTAVTTALLAAPLSAQGARRVQDWQYRWYWGVKGGLMTYTLPTSGTVVAPQFGGDWLITERRAALYVGYSQSFTAETDTFAVTGLAGTNNGVSFDGIKRLQIAVAAMVGNNNLQPYFGGGFTIHILSNARSTTASPSQGVVDAINDAASQAFLFGMAGVQYRMGRMALFASYQYTPQGKGYLLQGGSSNFEGGIRYALMGSREEDPTRR
jgi:hypothetical protein